MRDSWSVVGTGGGLLRPDMLTALESIIFIVS